MGCWRGRSTWSVGRRSRRSPSVLDSGWMGGRSETSQSSLLPGGGTRGGKPKTPSRTHPTTRTETLPLPSERKKETNRGFGPDNRPRPR